MQVQIRNFPEFRVATVRHMGPYDQIAEAMSRLGTIVGSAGLLEDPSATLVALYHDNPETVPAEELQSDAGLMISRDMALPPSLGEARIPAGPYATTIHRGPYNELGDVWARFMREWLPASGHRIADGPSYEVYLNNPHDIPPEDYLTELRVPLATAPGGQ